MKPHIDILRHINDKSVEYNNFIACRESLPTCNKKIEWAKIVGYIFDFSYQGFDGYLTIVNYNIPENKLYFTINDCKDVYNIRTPAFKKVGFRNIIKIHYYNHNIGDIVKNKEILDILHDGKSIIYKYKCLNDGYIGLILQSNLERNSGLCEVCVNDKVLVGYNDIPTTDPWMIPYFKGGYEEAKLYTACSGEYKELQCPHCGATKMMAISTLHRFKIFSCKCSDKIPLPEKYMINLLEFLNTDYRFQCGSSVFNWIDNKYHYDFYVPSLNIIVETNGKQHYKEKSEKSKWQSLEEIQERDAYKYNLAMSNGIKYYINLDCSESNIEKFKDSIAKSDLPNLLNFAINDVDWKRIDELSTRNIIKEICLYKEEHPYLIPDEIANIFHISKKTLPNYYKTGIKFGWCTYNKEQIRWVSHFHRNTHYCINGHYFYNRDEITNRSYEIFGEQLYGSAVSNYINMSSEKKLFKGKYVVRTLTHKEYLTENKEYPTFITDRIICGLRKKYS